MITDEQGGFEIELPPGTSRVSLDRANVPSGYRLENPTQVSIPMVLRETREVVFMLAKTAP